MTGSAEKYSLNSREFFAKASVALAQDDLLQASEKLWGAAAHMVKAVAQNKGWPHDGHRDLYLVINRLAHETGDSEVRVLFSVASALHSNFYENWMPKEMVADDLTQVGELIRKLESLA